MNFITTPDDVKFTCRDLGRLKEQGVSQWVLTQEGFGWQDAPFDIETLPVLAKTALLADVVQHLPALSYAVPYRRMGRCLLFAILPEPAKVDSFHLVDPPIPFFVMGTIPPAIQAIHSQNVRGFLQSGQRYWIEGESLLELVQAIGKLGTITRNEMAYFLINMQALSTGAWRFVRENAKLVEIEEALMAVGRTVNPARAQAAAYAYLVEGVPLQIR